MYYEEIDLHLDKANLGPILFRPTPKRCQPEQPVNQIGHGR